MSLQLQAKITSIVPKGKVKAYATLCIGGCFLIRNVKIVEGEYGPFISMPARYTRKNEYHDICFPTTREFRKAIERCLIAEYNETIGGILDEKNQKVDE